MAAKGNDVAAIIEIKMMLEFEEEMLKAMDKKHINTLLNNLAPFDNAQIEPLRVDLTQEQKELFLKIFIEESNRQIWVDRLKTDEQRKMDAQEKEKAEAETKQKVEAAAKQILFLKELELKKQEETKKASEIAAMQAAAAKAAEALDRSQHRGYTTAEVLRLGASVGFI